MRRLSEGMDAAVVAEIDRRLEGVAEEHGVRVPWAIESGSRAWGFPSPDSDYDCRFVFVRPTEDYLDPWPARDVIETPLDETYDVNGWDLVKAVRLAVAGNATLTEWLRSPIVYDGDEAFRDELLALANEVAPPDAVVRHYQHLAAGQWERSGAAVGADCRLKGIFYALRPAAALLWIERHRSIEVPMSLPQLLEEAPPDADVVSATHELIAQKSVTHELGTGPVPSPIRRFVEERLGADLGSLFPEPHDADVARSRAAHGFRALLRR